MRVYWLGHSCFHLRSESGTSLLIDPFHEEEVGYPLPQVEADLVLISHDHGDHNNFPQVPGRKAVIRGTGRHTALGIEVRGIASYHDREGGLKRGENTIFCFSLDGVRICHLGDLGIPLRRDQIEAIGEVGLLFLPVGGIYTIDAKDAAVVMEQLHPALVVPMHYQTGDLSFQLDSVDDFLKGREVLGPWECLELGAKMGGFPNREGRLVLLCKVTAAVPGSID
jgi:L-ascorbate metabolism protein UlaG (beta-lactamase superfamily)